MHCPVAVVLVQENTTFSQSLLNSVRHDQSKWSGKPSRNVSRPTPYDARASCSRKPEIVCAPYVSAGDCRPVFGSVLYVIWPSASVFTPVTTWHVVELVLTNRKPLVSPLHGFADCCVLNHAPPMPPKN